MDSQLAQVHPIRTGFAGEVLAPSSRVKLRRRTQLAPPPDDFLKAFPKLFERTLRRLSPPPPKELPAPEVSLEWRRVQAWVRAGRIQVTDLIDVGRGWEQVSDCAELEQEVDRALERNLRRGRMLTVGLIVANILWPLLFLFAVAALFREAPFR